MRDMKVSDGRLGLYARVVAAAVATICCVAIFVWGVPGLDPSMWEEVAVVSGLRPPRTIFPGFWRSLAGLVFPYFGNDRALRVLHYVGLAGAGLCVYSFCLIVRQILSLVIRVGRPYRAWYWFIAPFFAAIATLAFGLSDPFWRIVRVFSPSEIRLFMFLAAVHVSLRWFVAGGHWRLFPAMVLMGALTAETPFGFILPALFVIAYVTVWHCVLDGLFPKPEKFPEPEEMPAWRMFFLFLGGLAAAIWFNASSFVSFGGLEANGWESTDIYFRYMIGYWNVFIEAASVLGWGLGFLFAALPFVVALRMAPFVIRDDRPMPFNLGMLMFFLGVLVAMQTGAFPSSRFWTFDKGGELVESGFLLVVFIFCAMTTLAIVGAAFTFECHRTYVVARAERAGLLLKAVVPVLVVLLVLGAFLHLPKPVVTEMQRIVDAGVSEIVREAGDAKWIFTDGHLDPAIELESARRGGCLRAFNMMSASDPWEVHLRRRYFKPESDDYRAAETGVPVLLRIWAGERQDGMRDAALQLGFEFWKRDRKKLPTASGMLARPSGLTEEAAKAGVARAKELSRRILAVSPKIDGADPSPELVRAFYAVSWRLSRFARLREESDLANDLDELNGTLKKMLDIYEKERLRTFLQMTPREGLQIALQRTDFVEAKRYALIVLANDSEEPASNFAMGMYSIKFGKFDEAKRHLSTCLKKRPRDPAVLNNLSIVCRKLGLYKEALGYAKRAQELLPESPEVRQTLKDAERKAP